MSDKIQAYQYQEVSFTSTSVGADPLSLLWNFPGGTPATGSSSPILVKYEIPGTYSASLTVTDSLGAVRSESKTGIVEVSPSSFTAYFTQSKSQIKMGETYVLLDGSFGVPTGATGWYWTLPNGQTASSKNVTTTAYTDWNILTGGYTGAPGTTYIAPISLRSGNKFLSSTYSSSIKVLKLGLSESMTLNIDLSGSGIYKTGIVCAAGEDGAGGLRTPSSFGILGVGAVLGFNFSGKSAFDITQHFHSDSERGTLNIGTGVIMPPSYGPLITQGYYGVSNSAYTYFSYPVDARITLGKYTIPGRNRIVFAESSTTISEFTSSWNMSPGYVPSVINAVYPNLNCSNSRMFDYQSGGDLYYFPDVTGGSFGVYNPCVYSTDYFAFMTGQTPGDEYYVVWIDFIKNGISDTIQVNFPDPTADGSYFIYPPDDPATYGDGMVTILNSSINAAGYSTVDDFAFASNEHVNPYYTQSFTQPPFLQPTGIMLLVKDPAITYVKFRDNSAALNTNYPAELNYTTLPFGIGSMDGSEVNYDPSNVGYYGSCSGMYYEYYGVPGFPYENTITFGGSL